MEQLAYGTETISNEASLIYKMQIICAGQSEGSVFRDENHRNPHR